MTDEKIQELLKRIEVAINVFSLENGVKASMSFIVERKVDGYPGLVYNAVGYTNMNTEELDLLIHRLEEIKAYQEHKDDSQTMLPFNLN